MNPVPTGSDFPQTRWTTIQRLKTSPLDPTGEKALAELCSMYWNPLFLYARRCGHPLEDAEDLTQGFFARLLERDLFAKADPGRGRLRSFLLGSFKNFISEVRRQFTRQKRGGGQVALPLDESCLRTPANTPPDADTLFEQVWFDTLLAHALTELESEFAQRGKLAVYQRLQEFLAWNHHGGKLATAAQELGMSAGSVRVTILRMRRRFRELIERQIAETVATPAEAAEEMNHLRRILGGR